jgi:hypothetical protein
MPYVPLLMRRCIAVSLSVRPNRPVSRSAWRLYLPEIWAQDRTRRKGGVLVKKDPLQSLMIELARADVLLEFSP